MVDIPEDLLRRSAEAKARALGVPVEAVLAEMTGEGPSVEVPRTQVTEPESAAEASAEAEGEPALSEVPPAGQGPDGEVEVVSDMEQDVLPEEPKVAVYDEEPVPEPEPGPVDAPEAAEPAVSAEAEGADAEPAAVATAVATMEPPSTPSPSGNGRMAAVVSPRPVEPPTGLPEGVRTQRLLTVVKARAIQNVKAEPTDKVNTWPHLMLLEFGALLAITGLLVVMAVVIHSPLLDPANVNATPNPSKAPWYFLGLQELLSFFDPQIAGVMVPTFTGMIGFMLIPFVDRNPSTRPTDRKYAILLYSIFLAGSATLTIIGVLFRGRGFNFSYPWKDGIFFDDLLDWVHFE
jgi:menaquinol-cytochrome c reductase cytochrome b/c subunit